jgi:predicted porin
LNGRLEVDVTANFTSMDTGRNANGTPNGYKLNPLGVASYARLYPGFDGLAANGMRYGASIELRENFGAADRTFANTATGGTANSPSANSSGQTIYVRRAFTYLAFDRGGLVRLGQTDGVLGLFDNCIFTSQCWDAGVSELNGGGLQDDGPAGAVGLPWPWLAQSGADYGNNKIVYLTPQLFGFDFGVQYAPNEGNAFANEGLSVGCNQAASTCINVSSGNDATRWINQVGAGLRYQHTFGPVDFKAYGFYEAAGKEDLTTTAYTLPTPAGSATTLRYDNLNFYKAGLAVTAANLTAAIDYIGGAVNGTLSMRPAGGAPTNAVMTGLTYANGPLVLGSEIGFIETQGAAQLTGVSQRHEFEIALGGNYKLAPGVQLVAEYQYMQRHQGDYDFNQGAVGPTRDARGQGLVFSTVMTW